MSHIAGMSATPARRSARLSQAGSVTGQSIVTTLTTGGTTRQRKKGPLTKVKPRKSNAYGASGRVGAAEELSVSATGFAQAFQNQRGDDAARDDDDDDDDDDDLDELAAETPRMSGALNGHTPVRSPSPEPEAPTPMPPGLSFMDSEDIAPSENGFSTSFGNTSKSFGPGHEAGMLFQPLRQRSSRSPSEGTYSQPLWQRNRNRRLQAQANVQEEEEIEIEIEPVRKQPPKQATPAPKRAIDPSVNELVAEEQARLRSEGPTLLRNKPRKQPPQQRPNPPHLDEWLGNVEPGLEDESKWPYERYLKPLFWTMIGLFGLFYAFQMTRSMMSLDADSRPGMATAVNNRISTAYYDMVDWIMPDERPNLKNEKQNMDEFKLGDGTIDDNYLWTRMKKIYKEFDTRFENMDDTIAKLNQELPDHLVVRTHPDGRREVTDEFWNALVSKAKSPGGDAEWTDFLKRNEIKLRDIFGGNMKASPADLRPEAVSREEFLNLVQKQYDTMSAQIDEKVYLAVQGQASQIKSIAQVEAKKAMIDSIRLHTLAQSNLLTNYELSLQKANYFSLGLGAVIVPALTSATFLDDPTPYAFFKRRLPLSRHRNPPKAALDKWEEPGDCWCAAPNPSKNGQTQLTVALPRPVFPQQVTVEHLPMTMMPGKKVTTAPRTIELWVETDQSAEYQYSHREGSCSEGPAGWTCLGSFKYNIHASNHQQTFDLDAQSSVPVSKAMLRVTSNWGADHTCLYRVRLHGKDAVEDHQYGVRLNDPVQ
jgi:SUN domain-containing protein 1/2